MTTPAPRGVSSPHMRVAECKDCRREVAAGRREEGSQFFTYPEAWANGQLERGGSRSDRCREHRQKHQQHIAGVAVAYIDLTTVGEVSDRNNPRGPLGGLGPLPEAHQVADTPGVDLGKFGFGMDETHIRDMLESLAHPQRRALVVKAGTGTGKSTYMPYRLLDPPPDTFRLADLGPIVVTEPRVQATVGVAEFVGTKLSGAGGVGPGYPVGYQVSGNRNHDSACQLVYVTDGTMINWLREGRLSQIGTVIVDEAHERSTNIDFILGYLKRELSRYPHLRVIITSATFDADFYQQFFGGPTIAGKIEVPAVKSIGYGWPLFPELDLLEGDTAIAEKWARMAPELRLSTDIDADRLVNTAWPRTAPPLKEEDVCDPADVGYEEDLHETTRKLIPYRFQSPIPSHRWKEDMPSVLGNYIVKLARGLDRDNIFGDILGFLPTGKNIDEACEIIRAGVGDHADVFALLSSLPTEEKVDALSARRKGDKRKIVVSTNLAETSLTVEGVRFVVDSGLIAQSEWDPDAAQGGIRTKAHSQAGIKQRWGRVGRKAPGWVFPLYTKEQLLELAEDTAPGSTRDNLEQLVMTAKLGGVDDVVHFDWPAAFDPQPPVFLDETAKAAQEVFRQELVRANEALQAGGALDPVGDPTPFGKELVRFQALGSTSCAIAVMYADRLACVPEVVTILALLNEKTLAGAKALLLDRPDWPDEWRLEAYQRHRALASACEDDAELALQVVAAWERADPERAPWEPSEVRREWSRQWWLNDDLLRDAADQRREILAALSPAMKEEVKRFIEPSLLRRTRGAITRAFAGLAYEDADGRGLYQPMRAQAVAGTEDGEDDDAAVPEFGLLTARPARVIPLNRRRGGDLQFISNFVTVEPWAIPNPGQSEIGRAEAIRLLTLSARHGTAEPSKDLLGATIESWPAGRRMKLRFAHDGVSTVAAAVVSTLAPALLPEETADLAEGIVEVVSADTAAELATDMPAADDTATAEDASPELDTTWPTTVPAEADTEDLQRRAVLDHRMVEADELACQSCSACRDGRPEECVSPAAGGSADDVDVLQSWRERATAGIDVTTPQVRLAGDGDLRDDTWYEIVGYEVDANNRPTVVLEVDWRQPTHLFGPGEHPDLEPGQHLDVIVGGRVRDHRDELLVLDRADGNGRFVLREAHTSPDKQQQNGQLALSLNRQTVGLLACLREGARLQVTVVPRAVAGHYTVTLLEVLHQHLLAIGRDGGQRFTVETATSTIDLTFYPAISTGQPNAKGYVPVELLSRDTTTGLTHIAAIFTDEDRPAPETGAPIFLRLNRDTAKLSLSGRPLRRIREIVDAEKSLVITQDDESSTDPGEPAHDQSPGNPDLGSADDRTSADEVGTYTTFLQSRGPVPRAALVQLLELNAADDWQRDLWLFWARSRHMRTDRNDSHRPGTSAEIVDRPASLSVEVPPPPTITVDEAFTRYPKGSSTPATITSVNDDMHRAWLCLPDGTQATVSARDVDTKGQPLSSALAQDATVIGTVLDIRDHRGLPQVQLSLRQRSETAPRPEPLTVEQVVAIHPIGSTVDAVVQRVRDDLGRAWLELPSGVQATVSAGDIGQSGLLRIGSTLVVGQPVQARVRGVAERNGTVQVQVELRNLTTPTIWDQLDDAGIRPGAIIEGKVARVADFGVFVTLLPGVDGLIHRSQLIRPTGEYVAKEPCTVRVKAITEDRKKPGRPNVQLAHV